MSAFDVAKKYLDSAMIDPPVADPAEGRVIAVLIHSYILNDDISLALDPPFKPDDGTIVYLASEIPLLKNKTPGELREIHQIKKTLGGGKVVENPPACWNCGAIMAETTDIYGAKLWACWACARTV